MTNRNLGLRELNRATLARQMLLERSIQDVPSTLDHLIGLQSQLPTPPYVGLWTRLRDFHRDDLARLIEGRTVVKATWIRATLHLCTAEDYVRSRPSLQPMLHSAWTGLTKGRKFDFALPNLLEKASHFIAERPRTFAEITAWAAESFSDQHVGAIRYAIRTHVPLVQVPAPGGSTYPAKPRFVLAEDWIGKRLGTENHPKSLVRRYLAAFGPASATDLQTWLGMPLKEALEEMRPDLVVYRDQRRELFDLPNMEIPDPETPAPVRFLPEFDNLLLSHSKRTRVVADEHRSKVYLPGLRVAATFLVDGFVAGVWKIEKKRGVASLVVEPFARLPKRDRDALLLEGERLIRFVESEAKSHTVRFNGRS